MKATNRPYWNYRLVRRNFPDDESLVGIYEAHYAAGSVVPHSIASEPSVVVGETGQSVGRILKMMLRCVKEPILNYEDYETVQMP